MANIIVSTFTNLPGGVLDSFRQGFVDALVSEGNNVLLFVTNQFLIDHNASNTLAGNIDKQKLIVSIKDFKPDLFISVNHSGLFPGLSQSVDCPIAIWLLDGPGYLIDPEECKEQYSRYHMLIATRGFRNDLNQSFGTPDNKIYDLPLASDFQPYPSEPIHNVSFIGTYFTGHKFQEIIKQIGNDRYLITKVHELIESYQTDKDTIFTDRIKKYQLENVFIDKFDEAYILNTVSINKRVKVLDAVKDLGLALYGSSNWSETVHYSLGLALIFNPSPILTRSDLEKIYNASKICLNISHSQARGGLPWRVFDTMSCNGVLVSDYQEDFTRLFGNDVQIPLYESAAEAKEVCQNLLKDEPHRRFLAESFKKIIDSGHRFKHRLKKISEIFNLNLLPAGTGKLTTLNAADYFKFSPSSSRLDMILPKSISEKDTFSLQLFHSNIMSFDSANSQLLNISIPENNLLCAEFHLSNSPSFLRLDIGEYFSKHTNVKIRVAVDSLEAIEDANTRFIDLPKDIIQCNKFYLQSKELYCGFDSFCVFENPFPNQNIQVNFESILLNQFNYERHLKHYTQDQLSKILIEVRNNTAGNTKDIKESAEAEFNKIFGNYHLLNDMMTEIRSASTAIDTLNSVYPIFTEEGSIDREKFAALLYNTATANGSRRKEQSPLAAKTKAKLFYRKLKEKYNNLLRIN